MSIRTKISLYFSILFSVIIFSSGGIFIKYYIETNKNDLVKHIKNYSETTTLSIVHSYEFYKGTSILLIYREIYPVLENNPYLNYVEIISPNGTILFNSKDARMGIIRRKHIKKYSLHFIRRLYPSTVIKNRYFVHVFIPYTDEFGNHIYTIHYAYSIRESIFRIKKTLLGIAFLVFFSVIASIALSSLIARGITRKLNILKDAAYELERGNLNANFSISSRDEIGELALVFENMRKTIKQNIEKLRNTLYELKELDKMKNEFVANVSHELKTPLTSALGYISLIKRRKIGSASDEVMGAIKIIEKNLNDLSLKIDSILQLSKFQISKNQIDMREIDLAKIIRNCWETYKPVAELKQLSMEMEIHEKLFITGDEKSLEGMICNLIDNAVKFTNKGKVIVRAEMGKNGKYIVLEVEDTGVGIPKDKLQKIFDKFYQVESSNARSYGGIGLGLSIVKEVVELHNGIIQIKSAKKKGTLFKILLPVKGG